MSIHTKRRTIDITPAAHKAVAKLNNLPADKLAALLDRTEQ